MNFASLFAGVGGFDIGMERAGMTCIAQAERDKHCLRVLETHYPDVRRYTDVRQINRITAANTDVLVGGFPCQDVSVAGRRAGLAGERSGLWFEFLRILHDLKPKWVVIENVPGLLSSNRGRDFATILYGLGQCGYKSAWRVLDAQYWGVAQRRRRVFIAGCLTDGRAAQVLFEREGGEWNYPARRKTREAAPDIIGTLAASGAGTSRPAGQGNELDFLIPFSSRYEPISQRLADSDLETGSEAAYQTREMIQGYQMSGFAKYTASPVARTISAVEYKEPSTLISNPVAFARHAGAGRGIPITEDYTPTLTVSDHTPMAVAYQSGIRRLTPLECERLQGFPDSWTNIPGASDSQRYRQMGNAVCVPVAEWLGKRIMKAEAL